MSRRRSLSRFSISCLVVFCTAHLATSLSHLQGAVKVRTDAGTRAHQASFQIQGEYRGRIIHPDHGKFSGLQVICIGEGQFEAYLLDGGLPGDGWDEQTRIRFAGRGVPSVNLYSSESNLRLTRLSQYPDLIFVYENNYRIGTLRKVQRVSPTMHLPPPNHATVIFRDQNQHRLTNLKVNPNGTLGIGASTMDKIQNARIHVEFKTPFEPEKSGQARGNSGVYIQRRYEVQILDSFGLELEPNRCGGLYRQKSADINMAFPPESWQTYDIYFYAAQFDDQGKRIKKARITVVQNGVKIHDDYELVNKTGAGRKESPEPGPIWFQDHGDPVQFRNLWMVPLGDGEVLPSDLDPAFGIFDSFTPPSNTSLVPMASGVECTETVMRSRPRLLFRRR